MYLSGLRAYKHTHIPTSSFDQYQNCENYKVTFYGR